MFAKKKRCIRVWRDQGEGVSLETLSDQHKVRKGCMSTAGESQRFVRAFIGQSMPAKGPISVQLRLPSGKTSIEVGIWSASVRYIRVAIKDILFAG